MPEFNLKDYHLSDTIAALATPASQAALGVIKISGKKSLTILDSLFKPKKPKDIKKEKSFTLHYGWIIENKKGSRPKGKEGKVIDEVLVSLMKAPRSYTTEDVVEISSHGGIMVLNQIMEAVLKKGARLAQPGEFTYRALVNGRIDLLQAESILGLVEAKTPEAISLSCRQLQGESSEKLKVIKNRLKDLFVQTESMLNFPQEDITLDKKDFEKKINQVEEKINKLNKGQDQVKLLTQGIKCVICGRANSGKSTLFNRFLGQERVIVSQVAGTTRDVVEETINIKGVPLKIYDTAGILKPKDFIGKKSLEKAEQIFNRADLVILLFDGSKKLSRDDQFFLAKTKNKNTILVINKADLLQKISFDEKIKKNNKLIKMSALKDEDLDKLKKAIRQAINTKGANQKDWIFLNQYQRKELNNLTQELTKLKMYLTKGYTLDFINFSLKDLLDSLGKISGEIYSEEILESIFSNFCIGK